MKKAVLVLVILASLGWGLEGAGFLGLNSHSWDDGNDNVGTGIGTHIGLMGNFGFTPSCLPVYVGLESGFLVQSANYKWQDGGFGNAYLSVHYSNLVIPLLLRGTLKPSKGLHLGVSMGPAFVVHGSGDWKIGIDDAALEFQFNTDNLATDVALQIKGDVGIKLIPLLWLKPAVTVQLTGNPDDPFTAEGREGSETTINFSIGLAIKP